MEGHASRMDAINVDIAGLTPEDRHGLSFADFAEIAWAVLRFTYLGDENIKILRYSIFSAKCGEAQFRWSQDSIGYHIGRDLSLSEIARTKRTLAGSAPSQYPRHNENAARLSSIIEDGVLLIQHGDAGSGVGSSSVAMSLSDTGTARAIDLTNRLLVQVHAYNDACRVELFLPKTKGLQNLIIFAADALGQLGRSLSQNPNLPLGDLNSVGLLNMKAIQRSAGVPSARSSSCLSEIVTQQAGERPHHSAICAWDGTLTYSDLYYYSLRMAIVLLDQGVGRDKRVLLCMKKSKWAIVAMFGILLAGATCVPLDVDSPQKRRQIICEKAAAHFVVVDDSGAPAFSQMGIEIFSCSAGLTSVTNLKRPLPKVLDTDTAFIYFTSGSTGVPKGVVLEHGALMAAVVEVAKAYSLDDTSRLFQYAAYVFDVSMGDVFGTLCSGGCLCIPSEEERMNDVSAAMGKAEATHACLTSTVLAQVKPRDVGSLRHLFVGGEALDKDQFSRWKQQVDFNVVYGTTESLIWDSLATSPQLELDGNNLGHSIGSWLWVVDLQQSEKLMPIGAIGEILVEGPLLAKGYLDDSAATHSKFIRAPHWLRNMRQDDHVRCYKTGDVGHYNADGTVTFLGRMDTQVKIRGQRVELEEIEHNISKLDASFNQVVVEAVTLRRNKRAKTLAAFVTISPTRNRNEYDDSSDGKVRSSPAQLDGVSNPNSPPVKDDVRSFALPLSQSMTNSFQACQHKMGELLPRSMVPNLFFPIRSLPQASTGKLDRKALRQWAADLNEEDLSYYQVATTSREPGTLGEKILLHLWSQVLGMAEADLGANDHFLRLGGDSVMAMELVDRLRDKGITLAVHEVFENPQLCDMAARLGDVNEAPTHEALLPPFVLLLPNINVFECARDAAQACHVDGIGMIEDIYPATPMQEAVLAISTHLPRAYRHQAILRLPKSLHLDRFMWAWERSMASYSIFRTRVIHVREIGALQVVIRQVSRWKSSSSLKQYLKDDDHSLMGYGTELSRFALVTDTDDGEIYVVWSGHHAIYDGWSLPKVFDQVVDLYNGHISSKSTIQFSQFVRYLNVLDLQAMDGFWRGQLTGTDAKYPELPSVDYTPAPTRLSNFIVELVRVENSAFTTATFIQAAWALVTAQQVGADRAVFGVTLSGRDAAIPGITQIVGPVVATVPLNIDVSNKSQSVEEFLLEVQNLLLKVKRYQHAGLQRIRRLGSEARWASTFHNLLVIHPTETVQTYEKLTAGLGAQLIRTEETDFMDYSLTLKCMISSNSLHIDAHFDEKIVPEDQVQKIIERFELVMTQLRNEPNTKIGHLQTATSYDLQRLASWNAPPSPVLTTVHDMVEEQVRKRPDAIATIGFDGTFSYAELDSMVIMLAHDLTQVGVGPEVRVVLCFTKSTWPIVAMLAVLRCGGVCVSISPDDPHSRSKDICEDVEATILLCDADKTHRFSDYVPNVLVVGDSLVDRSQSFASSKKPYPRLKVLPSSAAFIVYTSGSTGKPKGSILEHQSICACLQAVGAALQAGPHSRVLQFCAYTFDMHILEIFCTLGFGGSICVISEDERHNDLSATINRGQVNTMIITPTVMRLLSSQIIALIDTLLVSGEPLARQEIEIWATKVRLLNGLGPSECCPLACLTGALTLQSDPSCIGRPLACQIWITEPGSPDCLLPIGCPGELLIEGPIVGRGYIKRPQATSAAFITNPVWALNGSSNTTGESRRFYRSGDLGRYNNDGTISFLGRVNDSQVKFHGQRIELGEIEYHLGQSQSAFEHVSVAVVPIKARDGMKTIVAFVRFAGADECEVGQIPLLSMNEQKLHVFHEACQRLHDRVPQYMIPTLFVPVSRMPLSINGKLDRKTLRCWISDLDEQRLSQYYLNTTKTLRQPRTQDEECLQKMWAKVLKPPQAITAEDHFFHLGGDSLLAIDLVTAMRSLGKSLTVSQIFRNPRLCDMAADLQNLGSPREHYVAPFALIKSEIEVSHCIRAAAKVCNIKEEQVEDIYPATPMQEALLAVSAHRSGAYHFQASFKLPQTSFDIGGFKYAWNLFISNQAVLRTRIVIIPHLVGTAQVVVSLPVHWLEGNSLFQYLRQDHQSPMTYGTELSRYAIVTEESGGNVPAKDSYFIWSGHHAIYDGWSLPRAFEEVSRIYEGHNPKPVVPYNHFVRHIGELDSETMDSFWKDQFPDTTDKFPALPNSYTPVPTQIKSFSMTLNRLARSSITTATLVQSAWAIVTARHMDADEAIFGLILSGRDVPINGISDMQGPTIATVPLRISIDNTQSVRHFLEDVQNQVIQVKQYQHIGLQRIRHLSPEAQWASSFQNLLVIHPEDVEQSYDRLGLGTKFLDCVERDLLDLALTFQCTIHPGEVKTQVFFDESIISCAQLDCILHQFEHVMSQLAEESAERTVYDLESLSPFDWSKLTSWNLVIPPSCRATIHGLVQAQVVLQPSEIATTGFDAEWTYQELDNLATALAQKLTRTGRVGLETRVGLCFHKSSWPIVAILAVLKSGGVCVSVSPEYPMSRLTEICDDAEISVMLCDSNTVARFTPHFGLVIAVDSSLAEARVDLEWKQPDVGPDNAAIVVYSSGSTGKPKGSLLTHESLCTFLEANTKAAFMSSSTRTLQFSSYVFDGHIWEILGALTNGGCVCVISESERMETLADTARRLNVNWAVLTPTVGRLLSPEQVPSLETLILTGEPLLQQDVERWAEHVRLLTGLGPSECSVMSFITEPLTPASVCTNIGRPVGCRVWLADYRRPEQRLAPVGCIGEILIEGPILGRGYLNRPQLNATAFLIDPKWSRNDTGPRRFYRSGDLARHNVDGTFTIIGRKDTQVKIRGQRVELGDIEHHLRRAQPIFEQVAAEVLTITSRGNTKLLAAFVRSSKFSDFSRNDSPLLPQTPELEQVFRATQRLLADCLPRYMVPSLFIPLRQLPVNASGKLERKTLRLWISNLPSDELEQYNLGHSAVIQQVTTQEEQICQQLWAQVLRIAPNSIGADDNFFQLGGDSVAAMELITLARVKGYVLNIADLFEMPELRRMASVLVEDRTALEQVSPLAPFTLISEKVDVHGCIEKVARMCDIDANLIEDMYPTTPMQEALLAISARHSDTYQYQEVLKLPKSLDVARFQSAWEAVVDAHAIFRTRVVLVPKLGPVQVVLKSQKTPNQKHFSSLDDYLAQDHGARVLYGADLCKTVLIIDTDQEESYFVWSGHHAIYDGWSLPRAFEEAARVYQGQGLRRIIHFNRFIQYIARSDESAERDYWRGQFSSSIEIYPRLPSSDYVPRPSRTQEATIPLVPKRQSTFTAATMIQAAWALTLARRTQTSSATFGLVLSGRDVPVVGIEDIVGPTITTVPVRVDVESAQTVVGFLRRIQDHVTTIRRYQHTGLQNIRHHLDPESRSAIDFQNLLVVHTGSEASVQSTSSLLGLQSIKHQPRTLVTHALTVECRVTSTLINVKVSYDHNVIGDPQLECLLRQFEHACLQLQKMPENTVLDDLKTVSHHDQQLIDKYTKELPEAIEETVHGLVEMQARLTPDAEAVCGFDGNYTYRSLNHAADKLAAHIHNLGVGIEVNVVLCFTNSTYAVVAMLAVLKSGAACVSVSPNSPAARVEEIIAGVGAAVLLADKANASRLNDTIETTIGLDSTFLSRLESPDSDECPDVRPTNAAFVVYTSGSTGSPKGIILEHRSICTSMLAIGEDIFISAKTRALQFSSYAFDAHISEIFATLFRGGCVCVVSEAERLNDLALAMHTRKVNWAIMTPTLADMVDPEKIPKLETLVLVGEAISLRTFARWNGHTLLVNGWGPSECAVGASLNPNLQASDLANIGLPKGCRIWITEENRPDRLAPFGCVGEMLVEGPTVGRGYINLPDTKSFLRDHRWSNHGSDKPHYLYRTGDLGQYNMDGTVTFIGRADTQVKIHGQRVELAKVENVVKNALEILIGSSLLRSDVAAEVVTPEKSNSQLLVAFVYVDGISTGGLGQARLILKELVSQLCEKLAEMLPTYMIPKAFIPLEKFPTTLSGKVDRKYLRRLTTTMTLEQLTHLNSPELPKREPGTVEEQRLRDLWASVLAVPTTSIGADDSFLQIGGDSVRAMRLVGLARQWGIELTVADIFKHPHLCDLALTLTHRDENFSESFIPFSLLSQDIGEQQAARAQVAKACSTDQSQIEDIYPCTALQEGLLAMTAKRDGEYIATQVFELRKTVDLDRFQRAWELIWTNAPILRTRIIDLKGLGMMQAVLGCRIQWLKGNSFKDCLDRDEKMELGTPLTRFAIFEDKTCNRRWFFWTIHHALYDARSLLLLIQDLGLEYHGRQRLASVPFRNFVQHITVKSDATATRDFWRQQLADSLAQIFPQVPHSSYQPCADKTVQHIIRGLSWPKSGITPSSVIRAAWSILMSIYTDTEEVVFGAVVSGRQLPVLDIDRVLGPTISTVPIRVRVSKDSTVYELQTMVQNQASEMIAFEQTGLHEIKKLGTEFERACGFQTLLVVESRIDSDTDLEQEDPPLFDVHDPEETEEIKAAVKSFGTYALTLLCEIYNNELVVRVNFDSRTMGESEVVRLVHQLEHVINCTSREETMKVEDAMAISSQDLQQIWEWNATASKPVNRCVHDIFAEAAQRHPDAPAIYGQNSEQIFQELTYKEVDHLSAQLAYHIVDSGFGSGKTALLCFEKSMWTPITMLAVMKAGGAAVALDSELPEKRLRLIVERINANTVLSSSRNEPLCRRLTESKLTIVVPEILLKQKSIAKRELPVVYPSDTLYIVFTSGSTGTPKGVVITHQNFSSAIQYQQEAIGLKSHSRVFDFASYSFDAAWWNFLHSFAAGACLCIPTDADRKNRIAASMADMKVNFAQLTPSVARLVDPTAVPDLRTLVFAGEPLLSSDVARWTPHARVMNFYGPAECSVAATGTVVGAEDNVNIGCGIGLNTWVLDASHGKRLVPIGTVGELWLEGCLVGEGYLSDPETTSASFYEDPKWLSDGAPGISGRLGRLYRTGDLVCYNTNGTLSFVGRKDAQVKLRGQRIELGEVEHHVKRALADEDFNVVADVILPKGSDNPTLVAFVSRKETSASKSREQSAILNSLLGGRLADTLPAYMIPSALISIDTTPMTAAGKIDRLRLRAVGESMTSMQLAELNSDQSVEVWEEPVTASELLLRGLWATVLGLAISTIGSHHSFFRIGGDSIGAMRLVAQARAKNLSFTVTSIFTHPRLRDLAKVAEVFDDAMMEVIKPFSLLKSEKNEQIIRAQAAAQVQILEAQIMDVMPCTPLQQGLLAMTAKRPGSYISQFTFEIRDDIDLNLFKAAWEGVFMAADILRTRITQIDQHGIVQIITKEAIRWNFSESLEEYICEDQQLSMGLGTLLTRFAIVKSKQTKKRFFIWTIHHALYDRWSGELLLRTVEQAYKGLEIGSFPPYKAFIKHITECDENEAALYWQSTLGESGAKIFPPLPSSRYEPEASRAVRSKIVDINWPHIDYTVSTIIRMAWSILLAHYTASTNVVFGATNMGRRCAVPGIDQMVGPTIATVPFLFRIDMDASIEDSLEKLQNQDTAMANFEHIGLPRIRSLSSDLEKGSNFQNLLLIQPKVESVNGCSDQELFVHTIPEDDSANSLNAFNTYALMLHCQIQSHGFQLDVSYDEHVISPEEVDHVCKQLEHTVRQICTRDIRTTTIKDLNAMPKIPMESLARWNECRHVELRDQPASRSPPQADRIRPSTEIEVKMQHLWADLLEVDARSIAANDSFLLLGGNSIQAMRLVGLARLQGLSLQVSDVFNSPILGDLAKLVMKGVTPYRDPLPFALLAPGDTLRSILDVYPLRELQFTEGDVADVLPTTEFQAGCVDAALSDPLGRCYHFFIDLPQGTSIPHVAKTCIKLWNHFDILRTVFVRVRDQHYQIVLRNQSPSISIHRTKEDQEQFSLKLYNDDFKQSLSQGRSFVRFMITHAANESIRLTMRLSHAQYDGMSLGSIHSSFATYFNGNTPAPTPKFSAFIHHVLRQKDSGLGYWQELLAGSTITHVLPTRDAVRPLDAVPESTDNIRVQRTITAPRHRSDATQASLFTACCACALASQNQCSDLVLGRVDSGRSGLPGSLQTVVGPCTSTIPIRVRFDKEIAVDLALTDIQTQYVKGSPYHTLQFSDIVRHCTNWPGDTKEFGVSIQFQDFEERPVASIVGIESRLEVYSRQESITTKGVFVFAKHFQDEWMIEVQACGRHYDRTTIANFMEELLRVSFSLP